MIQFNLLPDVKMQYIRAKRQKHTMLAVSLLVAASALTIFILLFATVYIFQKNHLKDLDADIKTTTKKLEETPDLNKVLTVQNQLKSLPQLHNDKPVASRIFGYITQLTPNQASIGNMAVDFETSKITLTGTTDSISTVNKFIDTLKFTTFNVSNSDREQGKPFKDVVMSSFAHSDKDTTYSISLSFEPIIFNSSKDVTLVVPKIISTRSETEKPTELFKALPQPQPKPQQ